MCRAVLPAGSADAPGEVRCPRCAEMVVPAARKFCARCSRDVTRERRMKDAAGEYYCPECWSAVAAQGGRRAEFTCRLCGESLPVKELAPDAEGVCLTCRAARDRNPEALLSAASDPGGEHATFQPEAETFSQHQARLRRRRQVRAAMWVIVGVALVALAVVVVLNF